MLDTLVTHTAVNTGVIFEHGPWTRVVCTDLQFRDVLLLTVVHTVHTNERVLSAVLSMIAVDCMAG